MRTMRWFVPVLVVMTYAGPAWADAEASQHVDTGATVWMLTSTALVLPMVPGLAMFYGSLVRTKNVLGTMRHSFVSIALIGILWTILGFALAFGKNSLGGIIGWSNDYFLLRGIDSMINQGIPEYVLAMFQGKFAIITPLLIAVALYLGVRRGYPKTAMHPNNLVMTLMGAGLLWVGWFGFNAGSTRNGKWPEWTIPYTGSLAMVCSTSTEACHVY